MATDRGLYHAYSSWRIRLHRSRKPPLTQSLADLEFRDAGAVTRTRLARWADARTAAWSRPTTRKFINDARQRGFLDIRPSKEDQRKRLVYPTQVTITEFGAMVKTAHQGQVIGGFPP